MSNLSSVASLGNLGDPDNLNANLAAAHANAAPHANAAAVKKIPVNEMTIDNMADYLISDGEVITNRAFTKVKEKFLKEFIPINATNTKESVQTRLDSLKTISKVQEYEQELAEKLEKAEQAIINAPEKSNDPNDAPKLKGAMKQNRDEQKRYNDRLMPVLYILESKIKASNTLPTVLPLFGEYQSLEESLGANDPKTKRQKVVFFAAFKQFAKEIKEVLYDKSDILDMKTERQKFWSKNEQVKEIKNGNVKKTVETGALAILPDDPELKKDLKEIQLIINALEGTEEAPGPASSIPLINKAGTPLVNRSIASTKPLVVTVPIKHKDGHITYDSYQMGQNGTLNKTDERNEDKDAVVDKLFEEAVQSAKEGTKVVKMIYKDEPLIISLNITHPHKSQEKAENNMKKALEKEEQTFVPPVTNNNGIEKPGRVQNKTLSSLSMNELESAKQKVQKDINFVNTNTKVAPQNKKALQDAIRQSRMMPIETAIEMKRRKGGKRTAKKSKKNNKTKKSTQRSS
jgi:hypothetical protein